MYCIKCGKPLEEHFDFCTSCGNKKQFGGSAENHFANNSYSNNINNHNISNSHYTSNNSYNNGTAYQNKAMHSTFAGADGSEVPSIGMKIFNSICMIVLILSTFLNWMSISVMFSKKVSFSLYGIASLSKYKSITSILFSASNEWKTIFAVTGLFYVVPLASIVVLILYLLQTGSKAIITVFDGFISFPIIVTFLIKFTLARKGLNVGLDSGFYIFLILSIILSFTLSFKKKSV